MNLPVASKAALIRNEMVQALLLVDRLKIPAFLEKETLVFDPPHDVQAGHTYKDGCFIPPVVNFVAVGEQKREEVNKERTRRLNSVIVTMNGNDFDGDEESVRNLSSILAGNAAGVPVPWPIDWRGADNVIRKLSQLEAVMLAGMLMQAVQAVYNASWNIKDVLIPAAVSAQTIQSFDVAEDIHWL